MSALTYTRRVLPPWITIDPSVVKTFLKIGEKFPCGEGQTLFNNQSITAHVYRKGKYNVPPIASYNAFQIDENGYVGFYWDSLFLNAAPGYYIVDFFYCTTYCFSLNFIIDHCKSVVLDHYNEFARNECDTNCGSTSIGAISCPPTTDECGLQPPQFFPSQNPPPQEDTTQCDTVETCGDDGCSDKEPIGSLIGG